MPELTDGSLSLRAGNLYLSRELCDRWLPGIESVALLWRERQLLIVPLIRQSGGGLLLKVRNLRGDRVVHAQEFLREHGLPEGFEERSYSVRWCTENAALRVDGLGSHADGDIAAASAPKNIDAPAGSPNVIA